MLEHFIGEVGDDENLIAMINKYAANEQTYDGRMAEVVRAVALSREPVKDGSNSFYRAPRKIMRLT